ncbi:hypothetical protein J4Q44_G00335700 [Coregonus suidteri]|uniref:YqaJ viral recombinase domain-containing protein n=1 Tax=Coregonus suidteri TaxID=861788 RepID=A0AAN8KR50_9TELE
MTTTKTSQDGSHPDSSVVASASKSPPTQMHINKGSTLTPSDGSGDSAGWSATVKTPGSGTTRATASQTRGAGAKTTDTRYAKKNIPTVRYHPDISEKKPEAHQHSHSPVKCSQVRGKPVVSPPRTNQVGGSSMVSPPRPEALPLGLGQKMEGGVVEAVELQTRGQRENPSWFSWRKNRITASVAHRLAHSRFVTGQSQTPPASYLAAITGCGPNIKTRAMTWGIEREAEAVRRYQSLKSKALGRVVRVQECGLFIDPQHPWLAGSPDGIVEDQRTGQRLLCLEVKCPYKHRQNTVAQACREDPAFCLTIQDQGEEVGQVRYHLKPDHSYYTQIQCQLAVTGLTQADLVVFTLKETAIIPVTFDPAFWDDTLAKLEMFYTDAVLPYVRDRLDIPAMRPEK